jgi:arginase family enzyme
MGKMMKIIKIGLVNSKNTLGCEKAAGKIIEKLGEIHSNEQGKMVEKNLIDFDEVVVDLSNLEEAHEKIYKSSLGEFSKRERVAFLGGDHSLTYSTATALRNSCDWPFLIVFDAHGDCRLGSSLVHEEWLRELIMDGFPKENIILIGARNLFFDEIGYLKQKEIKMYSMKQIRENIEGVCDAVTERALNSDAVYVSVDIDAIDPAFAPATGAREPGGLSSREMIYFLQRISAMKNFSGMDLVDIDVQIDERHDFATCKLGAKLISEVM